ncbi:MAG: DinB family protein [Longimicrobiales bacterium]
MRTVRPGPDEFDAYYAKYIDGVPDGDIVETLAVQWLETRDLLAAGAAGLEQHRYAPDKWTLRESVGHVVDTERVFTHRALWFARGGTDPLPGMDQDAWAPASNADARSLAKHLAEWQAVRGGLVALLDGLPEAAWSAAGTASGVRVTVRALAWMIAGHERHHRGLWRDAYGVGGE